MNVPYEHPGTPDLRSPIRFMGWMGRGQWRTLVMGMLLGTIWMVAQALVPAAISRAIDDGLVGGDRAALLRWCAAIVGLAVIVAAAGSFRHYYAVVNWLRAAMRAAQFVGWKVADTGAALPRTVPTGEVVATVASDSMRLGGVYDIAARFSGAIVSYVVVAVILLQASTPLGLLVLVGVPVMLGCLSFIVRPLQRRQAQQREESGRLVSLGADTVAGLRVLRGIGGEATFLRRYADQSQQVRQVGVRVAGVQAALDASHVLLPGVFVLLVTWLGSRFALDGQITVGQLVALYGYSAFLVVPLSTATEFVDRYTRARIGARRIITVLSIDSDDVAANRHSVDGPHVTGSLRWDQVALVDPVTQLVATPGDLTAVVTAVPDHATALADRLGRFGPAPTPARLVGATGDDGGEVALADLPIEQVREHVVVSENDPRLFTGSLRGELDPTGRLTDEEILAGLALASGDDILEALPDGLDSDVEERGRSFSGGQRQRLALTRALLRDPAVLVLVEPTSAVDAHTEARIARRLSLARRGRTTIVATASPLVLECADRVVFLVDGVTAATGRHHDLLRHHPAYRAVVTRGED